MTEAEITCECAFIQLADLQLTMTKGMVVYIDAAKARQSVDLQRAGRVTGVTIKYVQRFRERRPEPVAPNPVFPTPPGFSSYAEDHPPQVTFDYEVVAQRVASLLAPLMQTMIDQAMQGVRFEAPVGPTGSVGSQPLVGKVVVRDDVPVFIPSKIGRDDLRAGFDVQATEGDADSVSDALSALKAARKAENPR